MSCRRQIFYRDFRFNRQFVLHSKRDRCSVLSARCNRQSILYTRTDRSITLSVRFARDLHTAGVQNMPFCANARWGKFFKFGEIFEKLFNSEFFLIGNNKKICFRWKYYFICKWSDMFIRREYNVTTFSLFLSSLNRVSVLSDTKKGMLGNPQNNRTRTYNFPSLILLALVK